MSVGKSKQRWKQAERETAHALGTTRIPNNGYGQPDILIPATERHPAIAVQVKTKSALPAWFNDAINQSVLDAMGIGPDTVPVVVVVHAPGSGIRKQRFVIMRFADAVSLLAEEGVGRE